MSLPAPGREEMEKQGNSWLRDKRAVQLIPSRTKALVETAWERV